MLHVVDQAIPTPPDVFDAAPGPKIAKFEFQLPDPVPSAPYNPTFGKLAENFPTGTFVPTPISLLTSINTAVLPLMLIPKLELSLISVPGEAAALLKFH